MLHLGPILYHSEPSDVPQDQFLGLDFSYSKTTLIKLLWQINGWVLAAVICFMELKLLFSGAGGTLVLIIILYGMSTIPFSYIVSFLAKTPASGFTMSIIVNILAGCIAPIAAYVLKGNLTFSYIKNSCISDEVSIPFCLGLIWILDT